MKKLVSVLTLLTLFAGCKKDNPSPTYFTSFSSVPLEVSFHAFFEDEALVFGQTYENISGYGIKVTELKYYISNLYGIHQTGDTVHFADVALFNLSEGQHTLMVDSVLSGAYSEIGFGIGVAPEMNSQQNPDFSIALFDSEHPLSETNGMFWNWAGGYQFLRFQGYYHPDPDLVDDTPIGFSFHTGGDLTYRMVKLTGIELTVPKNTELASAHIDFHVDQFFYNENETLNLEEENQSHTPNHAISIKVNDLISQAISFRE